MSNKIPPDFNADWYLANYPDVALSRLSPQEHYRRFGKLFGRKPRDVGSETTRAEHVRGVSSQTEAEAELTQETAADVIEVRQAAIIDRPGDLDLAQLLPTAIPERLDRSPADPISLERLSKGPFYLEVEHEACASLAAYARLFGVQLAVPGNSALAPSCGAAMQSGATRIASAWFADRSRLRLMFADTDEEPTSDPLIVRAYQAAASAPAELTMLSPGFQLSGIRPVFHDFELVDPLMPLLLELSDFDGFTRAITMMPFPSLLPHGLHCAELRAVQTEANPMNAFWSFSDTLLHELLGDAGWAPRAITRLSRRSTTVEQTALEHFKLDEWLEALFRLRLETEEEDKTDSSAEEAGLHLVLPGDCVPSISALVSRTLGPPADIAIPAPFLIADPENFRPRWSVVLPVASETSTEIPVLRSDLVDRTAEPSTPPIHVAIALRSPGGEQVPHSKDGAEFTSPLPFTVILDPSDAGRSADAIRLMKTAGPEAIEILVREPNPGTALHGELTRVCGSDGWSFISSNADLRSLARQVRNDVLLTLSDRVRLESLNTLQMICGLLRSDEAAGSAACVLLAEKVIKRQRVLQPASGGLFPAGISFARSPRLSFFEPDVLQALPNLTYPVVANTLLLTAFRRKALLDVPIPVGPVPPTVSDIRLGLDLLNAGYRNLCTTKFGAELSGNYVRRDSIDPVGAAYVKPDRWQTILSEVAFVRELF